MAEKRFPLPPGSGNGVVGRALWAEPKPQIFVLALTVLYLGLIVAPMRETFWHDELFTFYISQSSTLSGLFDAAQHIDWQPPLIFFAARFSQSILGHTEFATRLPSVIAFYSASLGLLFALRRRVGIYWAGVAILLFWFSFYFKYATEARPYGLLLGFFTLSLCSYIKAASEASLPRKRYLWGLLLGNTGMMLSHVLAPFSILPLGIAELARTIQRRKVDAWMWLAIVCPLAISFEYVSKVQGFGQTYFPRRFQASPMMAILFFAKAVRYVWPIVLVAGLAACVLGYVKRKTESDRPPNIPMYQVALLLGLLITPFAVNFAMMRNSGAFWERYCLTAAVAFYVLCSYGLASVARWRREAGFAVFCVVLAAGLVRTVAKYHAPLPIHTLETFRPELPLVDASGLAFLEMDHYEQPILLNRLYYLTDRDAAIRYAHATLFEGFSKLNNYFPIRAHVSPYEEFVRRNKHFLVFATPNYPEDWLLAKLADDGATVHPLKWIRTPYSPYLDQQLFEVTFR